MVYRKRFGEVATLIVAILLFVVFFLMFFEKCEEQREIEQEEIKLELEQLQPQLYHGGNSAYVNVTHN